MQTKIIVVIGSGNIKFVAILYFQVCSAYLSTKRIESCKHSLYIYIYLFIYIYTYKEYLVFDSNYLNLKFG